MFRWKDYRINGAGRWKTMRLHPHEFIRRFLTHVLPKGFHRIRHYGLFANATRAENIATARALLNVTPPAAKYGTKYYDEALMALKFVGPLNFS